MSWPVSTSLSSTTPAHKTIVIPEPTFYADTVKLQQDQVWKLGEGDFAFIVRLERTTVDYKRVTDLVSKKEPSQLVSKKDFCRLIKGAHLMTQAEIRFEQTGLPEDA